MSDLKTTYMGLHLKNPLVASSSPYCKEVLNVRRMEDAGIAAIVLHSLFEEQITVESLDLSKYLTQGTESFAESLSYFPDLTDYNIGPDGYLDHIAACKKAVDIPIIGSLNGTTRGGWIKYARHIEEAGADGLELNIYHIPTDPDTTSADVENIHLALVREVTSRVSIPVAIKLAPYFSSPANMARQLDQRGASALVLFNRFYQPDFDLETLEVVPNLQLSAPEELRLRLRWVAILYGHIRADMAVTGGVHGAEDVLKSMMAGARVAMTTSALLKHGIEHARRILNDLDRWLVEHEYPSAAMMIGSMSQRHVADPAAFERGNYLKVLSSYSLRTGVA